jgi:hypothetical protein
VRPAAVSLLETDVEVDLEPSEEYDDVVRRERRRKEEFEAAKAKLAAREEQKSKDFEARQSRIAALKASIKPESADGAGVAKIRCSLPNGRVTTRRFATDGTRTTQDVYDYVRSMDDDLFDIEFDLVSRGGVRVTAPDTTDVVARVDASAHMQTFFVNKRQRETS